MTLLVADVGGTNTRIALIRDGQQLLLPERFQNSEFASFDAVMSRYAGVRGLPDLSGACIAVAGPVTSRRAQLTNLDWQLDAGGIAASLPMLHGGPVQLVNDLVALGHALADLTPAQLSLIRPASGPELRNNQSLVVGMGTGFNVCMVKSLHDAVVVIEAEMGHASLPSNVASDLKEVLGAQAAQFATYEHLLSGLGLSRLYRALSGGDDLTGKQILAGYDPARRDACADATELSARLLGMVARQLVFQYLPFGGIHFAGAVARGILGSAARDLFLDSFTASGDAVGKVPGLFDEHLCRVPIRVITDDAAALIGAARFATLNSP